MKNLPRRGFLKLVSAGVPVAVGYGSVVVKTSAAQKAIRFAVASDGHFGQPGTDYERFHREMNRWLGLERQAKGLDFVVFNGDLIHDEAPLLPQVKESFDALDSPYYVVRGNHDQVSSMAWKETWGYAENHAFELDRSAFLLASTSNESGTYLCADRAWLRDQLQAFRDKQNVFALLHICQTGVTKHSVDCPEIRALFEETANLTAVFHGHDHDQDNVIWVRGRPYFFDGHMGGSWGTNYRGYRIVEIDPEGRVLTYQCNPEAFFVNSTPLGSRSGP